MVKIMKLEQLLEEFLISYLSITPSVKKINKIVDQKIINDHIAFRTFSHNKTSIYNQEIYFEKFGYRKKGIYNFRKKNLRAIHLENKNPEYPKIFLSELILNNFSKYLQRVFNKIINDLDFNSNKYLLLSGRVWDIKKDIYLKLLSESEYASWLYIWGFRPNHFTISLNHLSKLNTIEKINNTLKKKGFIINNSGGEIKGSKFEFLQQSSIIADRIPVKFEKEIIRLPSCYYEFAKRYRDKSGNLYQGFLEKSANNIFDSTDYK